MALLREALISRDEQLRKSKGDVLQANLRIQVHPSLRRDCSPSDGVLRQGRNPDELCSGKQHLRRVSSALLPTPCKRADPYGRDAGPIEPQLSVPHPTSAEGLLHACRTRTRSCKVYTSGCQRPPRSAQPCEAP